MADFGFVNQDSFVTLLTPAVMGDYNADGQVNSSDYALWRASHGLSGNLAADGSGDGVVDAADYVLWRNHAISVAATSADASAESVVPEPGSTTLILMSAAVIAVSSQGRRRSKFIV